MYVELDAAIKRIKNSKSPGPDQFYPEHLRPARQTTILTHYITNTLCKFMERIGPSPSYVGSTCGEQKIDRWFRKFHSTTNAVLRVVENVICDCGTPWTFLLTFFNQDQVSVACCVDLEKAYDSVWREGLMYKLSKLSTNGRLWSWVKDFLSDRTAQCPHSAALMEPMERFSVLVRYYIKGV